VSAPEGAGRPRAERRPRTPEQAQLARASWRLGLLTAVAVAACVVAVSLAALAGSERALAAEAQNRREQAARTVDDVHDVPADIWVTIVHTSTDGDGTDPGAVQSSAGLPDGLPDAAALASVLANGGVERSTARTPWGTIAVLTVARDDAVVQVAADPRPSDAIRERMLAAILAAGGVGVVLAGLVGVWLSRRAVRPLADSLTRQRRFVADASHELRTPLTLLSTRVQLLGRHLDAQVPDLPAAVRQDVRGLYGDAAALAGLFDDLLLAADEREVHPEPVDVVALAHQVVAAAGASAAGRGVRLQVRDASEGVALAAAMPVRRALTALVDNALDHAVAEVVVEISRRGSLVRAAVADDGPGISPGTRVFERFASGGARADGRRHYGLGLALVAEIAGKYGGRVGAGPRDDGARGAQVVFELPAQ
jgi:signal transduction histidine kinase